MATTGVFNGTNLLLKVEDVVIGHTTSCTLTISHDIADATTKDSQGWSEGISGLRSGEISFDGLIDYSDATNVIDLFDMIANRTIISCKIGTAATGDTVLSAEGYLTSLEQTGEMEASATYSGSIQLTGAISKSVNA